MSLSAAILDALVAAGATAEMIAAAVKADMAERDVVDTSRRARAAEKKRQQRAMSPPVPGTDRDIEGQRGTPLETKVSPQTPLQKLNPQTPPLPPTGEFPPQPVAKPFDEAWSAYPALGRERSNNRAKTLPFWRTAAKAAGGEDRLLAAVRRYVRLDKTYRGDAGPPGFHKWLKDGRWEHWLEPEGAGAIPLHTFADPEVRSAAIAQRDADWVGSWLDPSDWDAGSRTITPRNGVALSRLRDLAGLWKTLGVTVQARAA